jgi:hypothetical protein
MGKTVVWQCSNHRWRCNLHEEATGNIKRGGGEGNLEKGVGKWELVGVTEWGKKQRQCRSSCMRRRRAWVSHSGGEAKRTENGGEWGLAIVTEIGQYRGNEKLSRGRKMGKEEGDRIT